jgi:hypothetical protein
MDLKTVLRAQWDRTAAAAAAGLGLIVLIIGWFGASGTAELGRQIPYFISGGLGGVFLLGLGGMLWLSADLRDQWRELRRIRISLEAAPSVPAVPPAPVPAPVPVVAESATVPKATNRNGNGRRKPIKAQSRA